MTRLALLLLDGQRRVHGAAVADILTHT